MISYILAIDLDCKMLDVRSTICMLDVACKSHVHIAKNELICESHHSCNLHTPPIARAKQPYCAHLCLFKIITMCTSTATVGGADCKDFEIVYLLMDQV